MNQGSCGFDREFHDERRSLAKFTLDLDRAIVVKHDGAGNRESQTSPTQFPAPCLVGTIETFEDLGLIFEGDADARVDHFEDGLVASFLRGQMDASGPGRVLYRVVDQNIQ